MRWAPASILLAVALGVACAQGMPTVSREELGSGLLADGMGRAEEALQQAQSAVGRTEFTTAAFHLADAELELALALEYALSPEHMAAKWMREGIDKCRKDIEEWGGDEPKEKVAQAWWDRVFTHHCLELAMEVRGWVDDEGGWLNAEETYWIPAYFTRIVEPELATFRERYPNAGSLSEFVPDVELTAGNGNPRCPHDEADQPRYEWTVTCIEAAIAGVAQLEGRSLDRLIEEAKENVLREDGTGVPLYAIQAMDGARIILMRHPDNETAQKIADKARPFIEEYQAKFQYKIEDTRMPEDQEPGDAALHDQMKAAYEKEAEKRGWQEQVLRVVVTSDWSEGAEAWWVGDEVRAGYFKRIHGALAVKQKDGCRVMYCLFRHQMVDGQWGAMYLGKVVTSRGILEENVPK